MIFVTFGSGTIGAMCDEAVTDSAPAAFTYVTEAPESMYASVCTAGSTLTTIAPPTAVPPVDRPPESARLWKPSGAAALTVTAPVELTTAPWSMKALVRKVSTWTATDAAMLAVFLPPAAAMPQTTKSLSLLSGETASTVTPLPLT